MEKYIDTDGIRKKILSFSLDRCKHGSQGYKRVLLQLFGYAGHGKSSLINSCIYALSDREYRKYADTGVNYRSKTLKRTSYDLTHNIAIVDNRGFQKMNKMQMNEIFLQLVHFSPQNESGELPKNFGELVNKLEQGDPQNYTDLIVPVFVYSTAKKLPKEEEENMEMFITTCRKMTGVAPTIVLTHKDCGDIENMKKAFRRIGADEIYKLENYTDEDHCKDDVKDRDILTFLHDAKEDVIFQLEEECRDAKTERGERRKFLLNYFHKQYMTEEKTSTVPSDIRRLRKDL